MAVTYNWNTISADQCDADSPIDEILMEAIRQNLIHLEEWLGKDYTAAENHDHNGTNSKLLDSADKVDGYHAGNSSGQVSISNGTVCSNLNADMVDGGHYGGTTLQNSQGIPTPITVTSWVGVGLPYLNYNVYTD